MRLPLILTAPHRGFFLCGMAQALWAMGFWAYDIGGRQAGLWLPMSWQLPPPWAHGLMLVYGVFPLFFFGFILTAGPRWQGLPDTPRRVHVPTLLLMATGLLLIDAGWFWPALLPVGTGFALAGWLVALRFLWFVARQPLDDRRHIGLAVAALTAGWAGLGIFGAYAVTGKPVLGALAIVVGLWGCLFPVFLVVVHRMLPFFTSGAIRGYVIKRPFWALATLLAAGCIHGALSFANAPQWTWLVDVPAALAALHLTRAWRLWASFAANIVAVLHVAFAWVGVAFVLFSGHSLSLLSGGGGLGLAPLHALTLGFFSSVVLGMGSRVTLGHSGRPVTGDSAMWRAFWLVQAAACLRIGGEFFHLPGAFNLSLLAALCWLAAFGTWAWRYAPYLWGQRADGRPG